MNVVIRKVGTLWEVRLLHDGISEWEGGYKSEAGAKREVKRLVSRYEVTLVDETGANTLVRRDRATRGKRIAQPACLRRLR